jgi:hypothetical protein
LPGDKRIWIEAMTRAEQAEPAREFPLSTFVPVLCFVAVAALLASAFVVGRNAQIAADAAERDEIAREDKQLCTELGFTDQDGKYLRCAGGLAEIRRKQKERWDAAIQ